MKFLSRFPLILILATINNATALWVPDMGYENYKNPIIFADYSDPDVIRVEDDFYMVSSSFSCIPGIPVLHSRDLVNWRIIGHVYAKLQHQSQHNREQVLATLSGFELNKY